MALNVYNTIYTVNTVYFTCNLYFKWKRATWNTLWYSKRRFTTDADAETKKKPLIHAKVTTVGCVSPWTCKYSSTHAKLKFQHFFHLCSKQNWKCKIITFGSDFKIATFETILAKRFWDTSPFSLCFCMEFAANLQYTLINTALTSFFSHTPKQSWGS